MSTKPQQPAEIDGYLDEKTVAKMLGVTCSTLMRWRRERKGPPPTRFGFRLLYRHESLEQWLLSCERPMVRERSKRQRQSEATA